MKIVTAFNVISKQVTKHGNELKKLEFDMNASAANPTYVQLHDFPSAADLAAGLTAPAAGSVPKKSWNSAAGAPNNYKDFTRGEMTFNNGVFVCVSTTEATLTIGTGSNKFDMLSAEVINEEVSGTTEASGQAVDTLQIFSEATGAASVLRLLRMAFVNTAATVRYAMLFATDAANNGDTPIMQWKLAATGNANGLDKVLADFGVSNGTSPNGFTVQSQTAAYAMKRGASLFMSTTTQVLTKTVDGAANLYGEYK